VDYAGVVTFNGTSGDPYVGVKVGKYWYQSNPINEMLRFLGLSVG
jgi:hypothetical protein